MKTHLLLIPLLIATTAAIAATAPPERPQPAPQPAEDPCALARRIAQSPPCLAGSACEALDLFREAFGAPEIAPAGAGQLPPELAARLPDAHVALGTLGSYQTAFERLGEVSGVEVVLDPEVRKEKIAGELRPIPIAEAWRFLLRSGGLLAHFDGERVLVEKGPSGRPPRGRYFAPTFNCQVR